MFENSVFGNVVSKIIVFMIETYEIKNSVSENIVFEIIVFMVETYEIENFVSGNIIPKIIVFIIETLEIQIDLNLKHIMFNNIIVYDIPKIII